MTCPYPANLPRVWSLVDGFGLVFFQDTVSLCSSGHPEAHYTDEAGLKLTEIYPLPPERYH